MQSWKISTWMLELGIEMVTVVHNNMYIIKRFCLSEDMEEIPFQILNVENIV